MFITAQSCHHQELLAGHAIELSPMFLLTDTEAVADVVMGAEKAGKYDLANAVDMYITSLVFKVDY